MSFELIGGRAGVTTNRAIVQWMREENMADDFLKNIDWDNFDMALTTQEFLNKINERFGKFFMAHTSMKLYEGAKERRIMLYPVASPKEIAQNQQLAAREFWEEVEHPELNASMTYPGAFIKCSETPLHIRRRPPLIGEHNEEVYKELGLSKKELLALKQSNII